MSLNAISIETEADAQVMRMIRNICRAGFSHHNDEIAADEQAEWWTANRQNMRAWLYCRPGVIRDVVGFGLLRRDEQGRWCTVTGVLPAHAGKGFGKYITSDLVCRCEGRCYATARLDNPAAVKLHVERFWERVSGPDERLAYFRGLYASGAEAKLMAGWGAGRR